MANGWAATAGLKPGQDILDYGTKPLPSEERYKRAEAAVAAFQPGGTEHWRKSPFYEGEDMPGYLGGMREFAREGYDQDYINQIMDYFGGLGTQTQEQIGRQAAGLGQLFGGPTARARQLALGQQGQQTSRAISDYMRQMYQQRMYGMGAAAQSTLDWLLGTQQAGMGPAQMYTNVLAGAPTSTEEMMRMLSMFGGGGGVGHWAPGGGGLGFNWPAGGGGAGGGAGGGGAGGAGGGAGGGAYSGYDPGVEAYRDVGAAAGGGGGGMTSARAAEEVAAENARRRRIAAGATIGAGAGGAGYTYGG